MKVAILGANGFIGRHVAIRLARTGRTELALIGRTMDYGFFAKNCPGAVCHVADLGDTASSVRLCRDADCVIHLVGDSTPRLAAASLATEFDENLTRHIAFLDGLSRAAKCHVVFLSSGGTVYGVPDRVPVSEDQPTRPISNYGICKLAIELFLQSRHRFGALNCSILRLSNPYGPGQLHRRGHGLIPTLLDCAFDDREFVLIGDGSMIRDYVYIDDVAAAIEAATEFAAGTGEPINVGSGKGLPVAGVIAMFETLSGRKIRLRRDLAVTPDVPVNVLDVEKAGRVLGWSPGVDFVTGLALTIDWYLGERGLARTRAARG